MILYILKHSIPGLNWTGCFLHHQLQSDVMAANNNNNKFLINICAHIPLSTFSFPPFPPLRKHLNHSFTDESTEVSGAETTVKFLPHLKFELDDSAFDSNSNK